MRRRSPPIGGSGRIATRGRAAPFSACPAAAEGFSLNIEPLTLTVLINNHNYARYLREATDSALEQTYPRTEVVVVDDGSTDESTEVIRSYGDRIVPVFKSNGGQASAFNAGFAHDRLLRMAKARLFPA